jgi:putative ABC transport system permease protein
VSVDLLRETLRSLRAHALRFALTSLGITWGAFVLTYLTASMQGFDSHFTRELEEAGPKVVLMWPGAVLKNRVGERGARSVEIENEDVAALSALASVANAAPDYSLWSQIVRAGGRTKLFKVDGISNVSGSIRNLIPRDGRMLSERDVERAARVVYLGAVAAERLFGAAPAVGRTLQIESVTFRVVGVNQAKGDQMIGLNGWDDWAVFIPYTTGQRWLVRSDKLEQVAFEPTTREGSWDAIRSARELLGLRHDFPPDLDTALSFFNVQEVLAIVWQLFFGLRLFLVSAGLVTLLVGAIGVMNVMLVVVGERTNEIGLRKAVGASDRAIFVQFLAEAAAVCGISGVAGTLLGVAFTKLVAALVPERGPLSNVTVLDPFILGVMTFALVGVGIVAGIVPAIRAARIAPAEALRAT